MIQARVAGIKRPRLPQVFGLRSLMENLVESHESMTHRRLSEC